jgi:hypothetical protein
MWKERKEVRRNKEGSGRRRKNIEEAGSEKWKISENRKHENWLIRKAQRE